MSEILDRVSRPTFFWLILDCGHWYKWTGKLSPSSPEIGEEFPCPGCGPPIMVTHSGT